MRREIILTYAPQASYVNAKDWPLVRTVVKVKGKFENKHLRGMPGAVSTVGGLGRELRIR